MLTNTPSGQRSGGLYLAAYHTETSDYLHMAVSKNCENWSSLGLMNAPVSSRDPSLLRYNGEWYVASTANTAQVARIMHGTIPSLIGSPYTVSTAAATEGGAVQHTWAAEWFVDGADYWLIVSTNPTLDLDAGNFTTWAIKATNAELTTWAAPVKMDFGVASWIDCEVVKIGSTYHAFPKKDVRADHTQSLIYHFTASSFPAGPWTQIHTGAQVTSSEAATGHAEAPNALHMGGTSWRLYYDKHNAGGVLKYVESNDDFTTFGTSKTVPMTDAVHHASVIDARDVPSLQAAYWTRF